MAGNLSEAVLRTCITSLLDQLDAPKLSRLLQFANDLLDCPNKQTPDPPPSPQDKRLRRDSGVPPFADKGHPGSKETPQDQTFTRQLVEVVIALGAPVRWSGVG